MERFSYGFSMFEGAFLLLFSTGFLSAAPKAHGHVPALPATEGSGCSRFDQILKQAKRKRLPIVIELTGTSWCVHCREFTKKYVDTPAFRRVEGKEFIFWTVDTKQIPGRTPGSFTFGFIPKDAGKVVGCMGSKAPYVVFGPPAIIVIDPATGQLLAQFTGGTSLEKTGETLDKYVASLWKKHGGSAKRKTKGAAQ